MFRFDVVMLLLMFMCYVVFMFGLSIFVPVPDFLWDT